MQRALVIVDKLLGMYERLLGETRGEPMNSVIVSGFGVTLGKTSERLVVRGPGRTWRWSRVGPSSSRRWTLPHGHPFGW